MFDDATTAAAHAHAARLKIEPAALLAVAEVESAGKVTAAVNGRQEPLIRWEGHYFDKRLKGIARDQARAKGLAHPKAGKVKNPSSQADRWRLLRAAMAIDRQAALESISGGVGQVMLAHWKTLKYASVDAMFDRMREDAAGQLELMVRYIEKFGLVDELQRRDFTSFARGYNGAGFRTNAYHTKMASAYARISGNPPTSAATGMLRMGSRGARVRELQALLTRAGHPVKVDGDFGTATKDAVKAFQRKQKIKADGVVGPETFRRLEEFKVSPDERPGEIAATDVPEVKNAVPAGGALIVIEKLRNKIEEGATYVFGIDAGWAQSIGNGLMAAVVLLGAGLTVWALYGIWKSRQTEEGDVIA